MEDFMKAQLPGGFSIRPATLDDVPQVTDLFNAYSRWSVGRDQHKAEDLESEWKTPGFNLDTDTRLVFAPNGQPAAYIEFWDMGEPHVRFHAWGLVLPEYQQKGIGGALIDWVVARSRDNVALAPDGARVTIQHTTLNTITSANALLVAKDFKLVRNYYRMQIDFDAPPTPPELPEGITIRSITPGEEREAIRCVYDSFHDHWGFVEEPFDNYYKRWMHHLENDKDYDPTLWFMAMDGDEVAGVSLCYSHLTEDPGMAWVSSLGVRRTWRRKGLGLALLLHSLGEFHRRGKPRAGLGVDATSLTGATRLYERAGMRVSRQMSSYEIELRPGKDLMTQSVNETQEEVDPAAA
jgi:ribosomal protein S18 acetylase RimI-like enzyme